MDFAFFAALLQLISRVSFLFLKYKKNINRNMCNNVVILFTMLFVGNNNLTIHLPMYFFCLFAVTFLKRYSIKLSGAGNGIFTKV